MATLSSTIQPEPVGEPNGRTPETRVPVATLKMLQPINALSDSRLSELSALLYVERVSQEELFRQADAISIHCLLNDETRGMVNAVRHLVVAVA